MHHTVIVSIGYTAAIINVFILIPQVIKVLKTKKTRDLSKITFRLMDTAATLWLLYGLLSKTWPVVLANACTLVFATTILVYKRKNGE